MHIISCGAYLYEMRTRDTIQVILLTSQVYISRRNPLDIL
jgi:hypothetical protein